MSNIELCGGKIMMLNYIIKLILCDDSKSKAAQVIFNRKNISML